VPSVLIVGASRGIGLGLVDVHLEDGWTVHATTRDGVPPRQHPDLITHRLEVRDPSQLEALVTELDRPLDRIIHNAGVLHASRTELMDVNAEAPIRVVQALLDAGRLNPGGIIAIMTSQMGARRGHQGSLGNYGDSKAALNDEFRRRADSWRSLGAVAVVIHPGWVRTDMGGAGATISIEESTTRTKELLDHLTPSDHGQFYTWDGRIHAW
jgi:NAD(P)-dependent dehydrogenase (short-subunit alcohol dehydrogenase family)